MTKLMVDLNKEWISRDGTKTKITDMTELHLRNTLKMIINDKNVDLCFEKVLCMISVLQKIEQYQGVKLNKFWGDE